MGRDMKTLSAMSMMAMAMMTAACVGEGDAISRPVESESLQIPAPPKPIRATLREDALDGTPALSGDDLRRRDDGPQIPDVPDTLSEMITLSATLFDDTVWFNEDYAAAINSSGSFYVVGSGFVGMANGDYVTAIHKFAAKGDGTSWSVNVNAHVCAGCPGDESATDVAIAADKSAIYVSSYYAQPSLGDFNWRVAKYDAYTGSQIWANTYGTALRDVPTGLAYDDLTDTLMVVGEWSAGGSMLMRLQGLTGATIGVDTTSFVAGVPQSVGVDPTGAVASPGGAFYVVGSNVIATYAISGTYLTAQALPADAERVDVDQQTGTVCVAGFGVNLVSSTSDVDGWVSQYASSGVLDWSRNYDVGNTGIDEVFFGVAAKHGGHGCVVSGETDGTLNTEALTVDWNSSGVQSGVDASDDVPGSSRDNPGWTVEVSRGGLNAGRALVVARGWSQNGGGGSPLPYSWRGWLRWLNL